MFGYIRPRESELLVKELELYKAVYCGLCRALKKFVSPFMPLTLSYDGTLLAVFRMAIMRMPPKIEKGRCIASPFKKKCRVCSCENDALCYSARASAVLVYYNLKDDIKDRDKGFLKRLLCRVLLMLVSPSVKKIIGTDENMSALSKGVEDCLERLSIMEKDNSVNIDTLAQTSGEILALTACTGLCGESREIAEKYGMSIGKWLYIADALDDMEHDQKKKCFNPLIARFGSAGAVNENSEMIRAVLSRYSADAMEQLQRLSPTCYNNLIANITSLGLESAIYKIFNNRKENK
ncbi:MAG: hypothetical protein E7588_05460 [Ruminococcaceae bacterium]|nr:hypothetical protein [Oscillospiraceae bacterium]